MKTILLLPILGSLVAGPFATQASNSIESGAAERSVLMVISPQDFHFREYSDTRTALEASGLSVKVAAPSLNRCVPTRGTGQPAGSNGSVLPDLPLSSVDAGDYSAIVFVGGWGSSMYQYAYNDPNLDGAIDSFYGDPIRNGDTKLGDTPEKAAVNGLINDFVDQDKYVAAICHGVTVLAYARVDGVSPLRGKKVAAARVGSPAAYYLGRWYADNELTAYDQIIDNGGFANPYSGGYGDPNTAADDVIVDGRIITAENYDSAMELGRVIAGELLSRRD